jgi:hypothetical protein
MAYERISDFADKVAKVIDANLSQLRKPGVLSVRPGYEITGGRLTKKPAIVVTVERKQEDIPAQDRLPETLGGYPVDVRQATPLQRLRATDQARYKDVAAAVPPALALPAYPGERDVAMLERGQPLTGTAEALTSLNASVDALRRPPKQRIDYTAPAGETLDAVEEDMTIICHASPDAGWTKLREFLQGVENCLTVGMYDFTSEHILKTVQQALGSRKMNLVLDRPRFLDPSADQTDEETERALVSSLGGNLEFAWALENMDPFATAWIYPSAYHIKVAVSDRKDFWLSSGNWNNSNQPDIDPWSDFEAARLKAPASDRDWHVIVKNGTLARVFEAFLLKDLAVASKYQRATAPPSQTRSPEPPVNAMTPNQFFYPEEVSGKIKVQPLLTPDNYEEYVLPLIQSANRSLYMQTQYIHPSDKPEDGVLAKLVQAVVGKMSAGKDVRLLLSQYERDYIEALQDAGVDMSCVKIQPRVHNKGIIVDSEKVVISSQNWSGDGVARNRDAGLIIYNAQAAQYFERIFKHDWVYMVSPHGVA